MGRPARVKSIDALQSMSSAMVCFRDDARSALDDLEIQIYRILQWIREDCRMYWKNEVHRSQDRVTEARHQLEHAMIYRRIEGQHASCTEEKKALEMAKRRLTMAEGKVEAIKHWSPVIERAIDDYLRIRTHLVNWLEADYPRAVSALDRMMTALEKYIRMQTPTDDIGAIVSAAGASLDDDENPETAKKETEKIEENAAETNNEHKTTGN
jgi:hypothetical protein